MQRAVCNSRSPKEGVALGKDEKPSGHTDRAAGRSAGQPGKSSVEIQRTVRGEKREF